MTTTQEPLTTSPADIFISYSKKDRTIAEWLASFLTTRGYSVWWDTRLVGGDDYRNVLNKQLAAAKAVVVLWSVNSTESRYVLDEAETAASGGKLVSVLTEGFDGQHVPLGFRTFQWVKIQDDNRLLEALANRGVIDPGSAASSVPAQTLEAATKEEASWQFATKSGKDETLREFLRQYPTSKHAGPIRAQIEQELAAFEFASNSKKTALLNEFLRQYPNSEYAVDAEWQLATSPETPALRQNFFEKFPNSKYALEYNAKLLAQKQAAAQLEAERKRAAAAHVAEQERAAAELEALRRKEAALRQAELDLAAAERAAEAAERAVEANLEAEREERNDKLKSIIMATFFIPLLILVGASSGNVIVAFVVALFVAGAITQTIMGIRAFFGNLRRRRQKRTRRRLG